MKTHLNEYLAYYKKRQNPGYAVLVTGGWGVGKTYQVKAALNENERYCISLFGLVSADDIFSAVYAAQYPSGDKVKKAVKATKDLKIGLSGVASLPVGEIAAGVVSALLRNDVKNDRVLIFDDLERSVLPDDVKLGVINHYVEHFQCRVIVIAHDDKLAQGFGCVKEKLFGQTLKVVPQIDAAIGFFISEFPFVAECGVFEKVKIDVVGIFNASGVGSLRILRHVIEDVSRLCSVLADRHLNNESAMRDLIQFFSALNIEVRSGRFGPDDLVGRNRALILHHLENSSDVNSSDVSAFVLASKRYPAIDLDSSFLSDDVLVDMLVDGVYDGEKIRDLVDKSHYFLMPKEAPAWRVFMDFRDIDDSVVDESLSRMRSQFENREVTARGEMLHLFSLRFMMSENGLIDSDFQRVCVECKEYVDDLESDGLLPPNEIRGRRFMDGSCEGFCFWVTDGYQALFKNVSDYLDERGAAVLKSGFSDVAQDLLGFVRDDGEELFHQLCISHRGDGLYSEVPILTYIDPSEFVNELLLASVQSWRHVDSMFKERYALGGLSGNLSGEKDWLSNVLIFLNDARGNSSDVRRLRLNEMCDRIENILARS